MVAPISGAGALGDAQLIAGGPECAIFQPEWSRGGDLFYISDESGWGNLHAWDGAGSRVVAPMEADCGRPLWVFGMRSFAENEAGEIAIAAIDEGRSSLKLVDEAGNVETLDLGLTSIENIQPLGDGFAAIVTRDDMPAAIARISRDAEAPSIIRQTADVDLDGEMVSASRMLSFKGAEGAEVFGQYYPPRNQAFEAPDGALSPVIVGIHGGPSGMANRGFQWKVQFWTSRGFGFFDVDYSGSTGYGRAYRERLDGTWGVRDIADVVAAGRFLIDAGYSDPEQLFVSGGSSGGYGVLMALATSDIFAAGGCYYGISDLNQLLKFTHKFEGGYTYRLTGTTPDEYEDVLTARSPITLIEDITRRLIVFQGLDDMIVPPPQSRMIVDGLKAHGVPVEYFEFEEEGHGFRKAETIITALEAELRFYQARMGIA